MKLKPYHPLAYTVYERRSRGRCAVTIDEGARRCHQVFIIIILIKNPCILRRNVRQWQQRALLSHSSSLDLKTREHRSSYSFIFVDILYYFVGTLTGGQYSFFSIFGDACSKLLRLRMFLLYIT